MQTATWKTGESKLRLSQYHLARKTMRRLSFYIPIISLIVLDSVFVAVGQEDKKPAPEQQAVVIRDFQLNGEQWTCTVEGKPLRGVLLKPEGNGPFPAIIMSHGLGGNAQGIALSKGREFVKWGFVCIATDYTHAGPVGLRGGSDTPQPPPGKGIGPGDARRNLAGVDFSQAGARPENIRRALACLEILRQQPYVDSQRIAAYGHSMGAFVTIALAAAAPDKLAAAAITSGGILTTQGHTAAAPTTDVASKVRTPFLILQGCDGYHRAARKFRIVQASAG